MKHSKENSSKNIIIFILIVIILIMLFLFFNSSKSNIEIENSIKQEEELKEKEKQELEKINESTNNIITDANDTVNSKKEFYNVGETYEDTLNITFLNYNNNFTNFSNVDSLKSTDKMIRAEFEFENVNRNNFTNISNYNFQCYADGYAVNEQILYEYNGIYDSGFQQDLSKGRKVKGAIYYVVPKSATDIVFEYHDYSNNSYIKFKAE